MELNVVRLPYANRDDYEERLFNWRKKWAESFADGVIPPIPPNWGEFGMSAPAIDEDAEENGDETDDESPEHTAVMYGGDGREGRRSYGFDPYYVLAAFTCIPAIENDQTSNPEEEGKWRRIDDNLLTALLGTLRDRSHQRVRCAPTMIFDSDRKIIARLAIRSLSMEPGAAEVYWRKLLDKGPNASGMATDYIGQLRLITLQSTSDNSTRLIPIWHGMINFIRQSDIWNEATRHDENDVLDELLFVGRHNQMIGWDGDEAFAGLILTLEGEYESAVRSAGRRSHRLEYFIRLLSGPITRKWLTQVFEWCHDEVMSYKSPQWEEKSLRSAFCCLLESGWRHAFGSIRAHERSFACFRRISLALASAQEPIALEIQAALGRQECN
jgi:hypothetical protein